MARVARNFKHDTIAHSLTCSTFAGGKPLNHVAEALL
jgi:hypothetical protein